MHHMPSDLHLCLMIFSRRLPAPARGPVALYAPLTRSIATQVLRATRPL